MWRGSILQISPSHRSIPLIHVWNDAALVNEFADRVFRVDGSRSHEKLKVRRILRPTVREMLGSSGASLIA
jgi:hypothetical protein